MNNDTIDWYSTPLDAEDIFAGLSLISFATFFVVVYALVASVMYENDKDIVGFRFLFSASIADILMLLNYGVWPGITILTKSEIVTPEMRHWIQMYLDWVWFSMCFHYMIVSWSRFAAIKHPVYFRSLTRQQTYMLGAVCYVLAFVQVLCTHFQPWYVTFYYEPSAYGMLAEDFEKYLTKGQSFMFFTFHVLMIIIPIFFYTWSIILLCQHRQHSMSQSLHSNIESRLILPCIFNTAVFIVGQVVITIGTGEGKWATWTVMFLFSANSAVNPVLLITFSAIIRRKLFEKIGFLPHRHEKYGTVPGYHPNRSISTITHDRVIATPSPPARDHTPSTQCIALTPDVKRPGASV